jgi:hypothetical protein
MRHSRSFGDFLDKKKREGIKQLEILHKMLENNGMKVENFIETDDPDSEPYIYCHNPSRNGSFDGIRIYKIGDRLAFRIQKENKTHPYGSAYPLNIEEMFNDFLTDEKVDEKKAGQRVIEYVGKEIKRFFNKCIEIEREDKDAEIEGMGNILVKSSGSDYSSLIFNKS